MILNSSSPFFFQTEAQHVYPQLVKKSSNPSKNKQLYIGGNACTCHNIVITLENSQITQSYYLRCTQPWGSSGQPTIHHSLNCKPYFIMQVSSLQHQKNSAISSWRPLGRSFVISRLGYSISPFVPYNPCKWSRMQLLLHHLIPAFPPPASCVCPLQIYHMIAYKAKRTDQSHLIKCPAYKTL